MTQIITPEERLAEQRGAHILIIGPFGAGKTSLLRTLNSSTALSTTLFTSIRPPAASP